MQKMFYFFVTAMKRDVKMFFATPNMACLKADIYLISSYKKLDYDLFLHFSLIGIHVIFTLLFLKSSFSMKENNRTYEHTNH